MLGNDGRFLCTIGSTRFPVRSWRRRRRPRLYAGRAEELQRNPPPDDNVLLAGLSDYRPTAASREGGGGGGGWGGCFVCFGVGLGCFVLCCWLCSCFFPLSGGRGVLFLFSFLWSFFVFFLVWFFVFFVFWFEVLCMGGFVFVVSLFVLFLLLLVCCFVFYWFGVSFLLGGVAIVCVVFVLLGWGGGGVVFAVGGVVGLGLGLVFWGGGVCGGGGVGGGGGGVGGGRAVVCVVGWVGWRACSRGGGVWGGGGGCVVLWGVLPRVLRYSHVSPRLSDCCARTGSVRQEPAPWLMTSR